jgi:hypothetical protein
MARKIDFKIVALDIVQGVAKVLEGFQEVIFREPLRLQK